MLIFVLFPAKKSTQGIDTIERIALSFGLSIAIVPLIGLGLNYTPWGIRLIPILASLVCFICVLGMIAWYRWYKTSADERWIISATLSFPKGESRLDQALTMILAISILISIMALVYVIVVPKTGERFTEFYILGTEGIADNYPSNLSRNEIASVLVGIVNHEYAQMNYTVDLWAINQSFMYNETRMENETVYHHMWFLERRAVALDHIPIDIEGAWQPQWEQNWSFSLNHTGTYKLCFMLFADEQQEYVTGYDYATYADEKITSAYREVHLWIEVSE